MTTEAIAVVEDKTPADDEAAIDVDSSSSSGMSSSSDSKKSVEKEQ